MDAPQPVPVLSSAELEEFHTEGTQAYPPLNSAPEQRCCEGIDTPGVGFVHDWRCPGAIASSHVFVDRVEKRDALGASLRKHLREMNVLRLIVGARDLAYKQQTLRHGFPGVELRCAECLMVAPATGGAIPHTQSCVTGGVLAVIAELEADLALDSQIAKGKETAPTGESVGTGSATDGKPSQSGFGEPWSYRIDQLSEAVLVLDVDHNWVLKVLGMGARSQNVAARIVDCVNSQAGVDLLAKAGAAVLIFLALFVSGVASAQAPWPRAVVARTHHSQVWTHPRLDYNPLQPVERRYAIYVGERQVSAQCATPAEAWHGAGKLPPKGTR